MPNNNEPQPINNKLQRSNIETIDTAFFRYIDEKLNIHCTTAEGFKKVPVIWANSERAYQIKNNISLRDINGSLIPPIISITRKSISKDPQKKGMFQANLAPNQNRIVYSEELNQEKTSNFANADTLRRDGQLNFITSKKNKKKVYRYKSVLMPVYVTIDYEIDILTSYVQQLNEITQPFMTRTAALNYFVIEHESFRYEAFIQQEFSSETKINADDEKRHESKIVIKVLGQLIGDDTNQDIPSEKTTENPVEIKFPRESLFFVEEEPKLKTRRPTSGAEVVQTSASILRKKTFIIGGGTNPIYTVDHYFSTRDIIVFIRENTAPYGLITAAIDYSQLDSIEINMGDPVPDSSYSVTVLG